MIESYLNKLVFKLRIWAEIKATKIFAKFQKRTVSPYIFALILEWDHNVKLQPYLSLLDVDFTAEKKMYTKLIRLKDDASLFFSPPP